MNISNKTILIVDDNATNRFVIEMMLEPHHCKILQAENGLEAVDIYKEKGESIDLILMDISMPEMDGYTATQHIRQYQSQTGAKTPIVALTAHALKEDRQRCIDAGMDDYASKPFTEEQFKRIITDHLDQAA